MVLQVEGGPPDVISDLLTGGPLVDPTGCPSDDTPGFSTGVPTGNHPHDLQGVPPGDPTDVPTGDPPGFLTGVAAVQKRGFYGPIRLTASGWKDPSEPPSLT